MATAVQWIQLGHLHYDDALDIQLKRAQALLEGEDDRQTVYTVEHPPTITIGRNGSMENVLADESFLSEHGFTIREVDRGGDVTYHGPGQLVVYPVLHLAPWGNDVKRYVRNLEEAVIRALAEVGIQGARDEAYPGVWVGDAKICAVGARVKKRHSGEFVTYHGIALNVDTDLSHFQTIVPCGIADRDVTSLSRELGRPADLLDWETRLKRAFFDVFEFEA
ncbi:octanoyltransferase [Alicyclobacillus acidoterrestris]|uniref:lipoyl(octanoyl) transferase LipB n=1 Tax=Alicyclobacillus suci TaxID=2816080 RepID=UPI001190436D|nr:lipoyl(octanoyl) transferase LipB [Alicyclobacillus suci]GEO25756.1 octanoyltransferase [Alicyclobacillus acidoterrestris]